MAVNLELMKAARQSIVDDREFDMSTWDHCVAGHICKVAGVQVVRSMAPHPVIGAPCSRYAAIVNGQPRSVAGVARELAGDSVDQLFGYSIWQDSKNKQMFLNRFDRFMKLHEPEPQPQPQPEMRQEQEQEQEQELQELVCA